VRDYVIAAFTAGVTFAGFGEHERPPRGDVLILTYEEAKPFMNKRCRVLGADLDRIPAVAVCIVPVLDRRAQLTDVAQVFG